MTFLFALFACFASLGQTVQFTECPASSQTIEDCRTRTVVALTASDLRAEMDYVSRHEGWVRASCGAREVSP